MVMMDRLGALRKKILRLQSFMGRKLKLIVDQLGPLQKSLDSEVSESPGQKVDGNTGPAGTLVEKFRF